MLYFLKISLVPSVRAVVCEAVPVFELPVSASHPDRFCPVSRLMNLTWACCDALAPAGSVIVADKVTFALLLVVVARVAPV